MTTQRALAEAAEIGPNRIRTITRELLESGEGWTFRLPGTPKDRYPEGLKATVLGMARELMSLGFRERTTVLVVADLCDGALKLGTVQRWVYSLNRPRPEVQPCAEVCREHGERCRSRLKHARVHFHLTKGVDHLIRASKREAHFWDTGPRAPKWSRDEGS